MIVVGGSTDVTTYFQMRLLAGGDATGLTISDFDMQYVRTGATPAAKVDAVALAAANTAHTDNRGIEVDSTDTPGLYRFDWPDAAFAASVREVILTIKHTSCFTESLRVQIDPVVSANVTQFGGSAGTFSSGRPEVNTTHIAGSSVSTSSAQIGVNVVNAGGTAWASGSLGAGVIAAGAITSTKFAAGAITAGVIADGAIDAATFAADVDAEILSYLVDDATRIDASALNTATGTTIPAILDDTDLIDDGTSGLAKIATDVAAILVDTGTTLDTLVKDIPTNAELTTALASADDAVLAAIAGLNDAPDVSSDVTAIKAKTDSLTFTQAGQVDANIQYVNDVQVTGTGALGDEWGP